MKYLYLLRAEGDTYKVGVSSNIYNRIKELQTGNHSIIELVMATPIDDARGIESSLHGWLNKHRLSGGNEWFRLEPELVIELISKITAAAESEILRQITMRNLFHRQTMVEKRIAQIYDRVDRKLESLKPKEVSLPLRRDEQLLNEATEIVRQTGKASASLFQRRLRIGYARAAWLLDELERAGIVGPAYGARAREVLTNNLVAQPD